MTGAEILSGGNIEPRGLEEEMRSSYLDYAMSVIVGQRAPDDHAHRVVEIGGAHLLLEPARLDVPARQNLRSGHLDRPPATHRGLSLIHISEPTRRTPISY